MAAVTIPACFTDSAHGHQERVIPGLNVLHTTNEPSTAATAYGFDKKPRDERNILIFDLVRGAFGEGRARGSRSGLPSDTHLDGEDFNNRLVNHFVQVQVQEQEG